MEFLCHTLLISIYTLREEVLDAITLGSNFLAESVAHYMVYSTSSSFILTKKAFEQNLAVIDSSVQGGCQKFLTSLEAYYTDLNFASAIFNNIEISDDAPNTCKTEDLIFDPLSISAFYSFNN